MPGTVLSSAAVVDGLACAAVLVASGWVSRAGTITLRTSPFATSMGPSKVRSMRFASTVSRSVCTRGSRGPSEPVSSSMPLPARYRPFAAEARSVPSSKRVLPVNRASSTTPVAGAIESSSARARATLGVPPGGVSWNSTPSLKRADVSPPPGGPLPCMVAARITRSGASFWAGNVS